MYHAEYRDVRVKADTLHVLAESLVCFEIPPRDCYIWKDDSFVGIDLAHDEYNTLCRLCAELSIEGDNGRHLNSHGSAGNSGRAY